MKQSVCAAVPCLSSLQCANVLMECLTSKLMLSIVENTMLQLPCS